MVRNKAERMRGKCFSGIVTPAFFMNRDPFDIKRLNVLHVFLGHALCNFFVRVIYFPRSQEKLVAIKRNDGREFFKRALFVHKLARVHRNGKTNLQSCRADRHIVLGAEENSSSVKEVLIWPNILVIGAQAVLISVHHLHEIETRY